MEVLFDIQSRKWSVSGIWLRPADKYHGCPKSSRSDEQSIQHDEFPKSTMTRAKAGPDPVSCQSCRIRKLRCSRKSPCSNCVARHIPCNFSTTAQRSRSPLNPATHDAQILNRLEVLEGLILPANVAEPGHSKSRLRSSKHATPEAREASDLQELENIGTGLNSAVHNVCTVGNSNLSADYLTTIVSLPIKVTEFHDG